MSGNYEAGSLRSVRMINFMKHSNLCIDLTPHVNFITGRNGSGKSSILVAISVGLGCNSRLSGRGSNLSDLIKDGQNKAIITITIQNGSEGYNYALYGDTITIRRSITKSSSSFEIEGFKKGNQPLIKEELERIRSFYNIQIDNPCSIMHQDTAREFIGTSTPGKKYDLFMRGTLLSHLSEEITGIKQNIKVVETLKAQRVEEKAELDKEFTKQERLYQVVQEADSVHQRIHDLEDELVWSHYYVANQASKDVDNKLRDAKQLVDAKANEVEAKRQEKLDAEEQYKEYEEKYRESMALRTEIKREIEKITTDLAPIKAELNQQKSLLEHRNNSIHTLKNDIHKKQTEHDRLNAERSRIMQEAEIKKKKFVESRQTEIQQIEPTLHGMQDQIGELSSRIKELLSNESQLASRSRELDSRYKSTKDKYDTLKCSFNDRNQNHQGISGRGYVFKPIGPLLNYIHMAEGFEDWNVAAQHIIGKALDTYIVSCRQDEQTLRRTNPNAALITTSFTCGRYNIGNVRAPCPEATRIIDTLHFTDEEIVGQFNRQPFTAHTSDIIYNVIIDQYNADRIWCIENDVVARDVAYRGAIPGAITKNGVQYKIQNGFEIRLGAKHTSSRIGQDQSARIIQLEADCRYQKAEADSNRQKLSNLREELKTLKNQRSSIDNEHSKRANRISRLRAELQNPPSDGNDIDDRIASLSEQIERQRKKITDEEGHIPQVQTRIEGLLEQKKQLQEKIASTRDRLTSNDIDKTANDNLYRNLKIAERALDNIMKDLDSLTKRYQSLQNDLSTKQNEARSVYEKAKKHSPQKEAVYTDANPPRSPVTLSQLLKEERRKYEEAQKAHGLDFNQVRNQYEKTKREVQHAVQYLAALSEFIEHSADALGLRVNKLEEMRHSITRRTKVSFMQYQSKRKYAGKLRFNHETHVIDIAVRQKTDSEFTDVSNLSGGEKSFCLVSLLLSLWDVMECPFYCIDEFDVFMDDINRQAATSLLVSGAQSMSSRQFIFITPLSLDHLKNAGENVSIFEVNPGNQDNQ